MERRSVLKGAGAVVALAATGGLEMHGADAPPQASRRRGMARGLTVLNMRRNGEFRLAVKTDRGILDVPETAKALHIHAPATMDDLLQQEDGPSLNALVDVALKPGAKA